MPNAVIYARYSSHTQREESIEGQLKVCYEYARQNNINPYKILAEMFDKGYIDYETRIDHHKKKRAMI